MKFIFTMKSSKCLNIVFAPTVKAFDKIHFLLDAQRIRFHARIPSCITVQIKLTNL